MKQIIILIVVLGGGYYAYTAFFAPASTTTSQTGAVTTVSTGTIRDTIKGLGKVTLVNDQSIAFNMAGTISDVYVKEGDKVTRGQLLAQIDETDINNQIKQAEINLSSAQLTYQELIAGNQQSDILKAQNTVAADQSKITEGQTALANLQKQKAVAIAAAQNTIDEDTIALQNAQKDAANIRTSDAASITQAQQSLVSAQNNLVLAQKGLSDAQLTDSQTITTASGSYENKVSSALTEMNNTLVDANNILSGISSALALDDPKKNAIVVSILGASNASDLQNVAATYNTLNAQFSSLQSTYDQLSGMSPDSIDRTMLAADLQTLLDYTGHLGDLANSMQSIFNASSNEPVPTDVTIDPSVVANTSNALIVAEQNLEDAEVLNNQTVVSASGTYQSQLMNAALAIQNAVIDAGNTLTSIDTILGVTDTYRNAIYHPYVGNLDTQGRLTAVNLFEQLKGQQSTLQSMSDQLMSNGTVVVDRSTLITDLTTTLNYSNQFVTLTNDVYSVLTNSTPDATYFPTSQLNSFQSTMSSDRSTAQSHVSGLTTSLSSIQNLTDPSVTQTQSNNNINQSIQAVKNAENTLKASMVSYHSTAQSHVSALTTNILNIQTLQAPSTTIQTSNTDILKQEQAVNDAQNAVTTAQNNLQNLKNSSVVDAANKDLIVTKDTHTVETDKNNLQTTTANYDAQIDTQNNTNDDLQKSLEADQAALNETLR